MERQSKIGNQVANAILLLFSICWILFIFLDYWQKHPLYYFSFRFFKYLDLVAIFLALGTFSTWVFWKIKQQKKFGKYLTGLSIYAFSLLIILISLGTYYNKWSAGNGFSGGMMASILGKLLFVTGMVFLILIVCYAIGDFFNKKLKIKLAKEEQYIVSLASGMMLLTLFLFLLGTLSLLKIWTILPLFLIVLFFFRKTVWSHFTTTLLKPITIPKGMNILGAICYYLLLVIVSLNLISIIIPMPMGFDALTLYANLPALINDYSGLVEGFQPYNWSLFMSLGYVLFDSTPIVLTLSSVGGLLCLFVLYRIGRRWFQMNVNYLMLALLALYLTPTVTAQSFVELKVDLALLFITLTIILLSLNWLKNLSKPKEDVNPEFQNIKSIIQSNGELLLIGLLIGFAMGIKLTTIFLIFAIVAGIWYAYAGKTGFFAIFLLSLSFIFLMRLDDMSGLRNFHAGVNFLTWLLAIGGLVCLQILIFKKWGSLIKGLITTAIIGICLSISFSPWLIKNAIEAENLTSKTLLNGKQPGLKMTIEALESKGQ